MALARTAGRLLVTGLGLSWRIDYRRPPSGRAGHMRGLPALFAFWHGRQLPLIYTHRNETSTVLISSNRDGEYAARALEAMGFRTIRGSTSRGGVRALREMAARLASGTDCALTPDGPRGPFEKAMPGAATISALAGRPAVALGTAGWPRLVFGSWDRFQVALPFARMVVVEGRPVGPFRRDGIEGGTMLLETEMRRVTGLAEYLARPVSRAVSSIVSAAAGAAEPVARLALLARPPRERLERTGRAPCPGAGAVMLHGSSMGEIEGLLPLAADLESRGTRSFLTCFTPAARAKLESAGLPSCFLPLDCPHFVDGFLERWAPSVLVLAETEIWPNMVKSCLLRSIPCMMVNARLSRRSLNRYKAFGGPSAGRLLSCFAAVLARSGEDAERFVELGVRPDIVKLSGDSKALAAPGEPPPEWSALLPRGRPVLIAGSTREGEELPVARAAIEASLYPVITPRHLARVGEIVKMLSSSGISCGLWSEGAPGGGGNECLVIDRMGMLSRLYALGKVAFVGGTIAPLGGHNILEPLRQGIPVVTGPSVESFAEVAALGRESGAVRSVETGMLASAFAEALAAPPPRGELIELGSTEARGVLGDFRRALASCGVDSP